MEQDLTHQITLKSIEPVTHDTHHLVFTRPDNFDFEPGQATDFALDKDGWRDEQRPFTFTSLPEKDTLEFVIKSYPDHNGVTEQIAKMEPGDKALIEDPWGAIEDEGPGTFIAGGAGITPFIAILRERLEKKGTLAGCTLIFSNSTEKDIILRKEFESMQGLKTIFTVTDQDNASVHTEFVDKDFLKDHIDPTLGKFYICGPDKMVDEISETLKSFGIEDERIIHEDFE